MQMDKQVKQNTSPEELEALVVSQRTEIEAQQNEIKKLQQQCQWYLEQFKLAQHQR